MYALSTPTSDGEFHLLLDEWQVVRASGFGPLAALCARLPAELRSATIETLANHEYVRYVAAYYAGDATALETIPRQQPGSAFQQQVWAAIGTVAYGTVVSYKDLAKAAGRPAAVRAAGTACGQNRLILLVPCHRVVKSDGSLGNYLYGSTIKSALLKREATG